MVHRPAVTTDYLGGFQYVNNVLKFFPHTEGYVEFKNNQYLYTYQYKDHLGNVRLTYRDGYKNHATQENVKDGIIQVTEIIDQTDYYPFGLKHNNNALADYSAVNKYKYAYNGKELNDELGVDLYDFGARNYDPALGRWLNVDPLAENSRRWTPYNYAYNNPIYFIDPDGMQSVSSIKTDDLDDIKDKLTFSNGYYDTEFGKSAGAVEHNGFYKNSEFDGGGGNGNSNNNFSNSKENFEKPINTYDTENSKSTKFEKFENGYDENGNQINNKGNNTTDYLYDKDGKIISSTKVHFILATQWNFSNNKWDGYGWRSSPNAKMATGAINDNSLDFTLNFAGVGLIKNGANLFRMGITKIPKSSVGIRQVLGSSPNTLKSSVYFESKLGSIPINVFGVKRLPTLYGPSSTWGTFLGRNSPIIGSGMIISGGTIIYY